MNMWRKDRIVRCDRGVVAHVGPVVGIYCVLIRA